MFDRKTIILLGVAAGGILFLLIWINRLNQKQFDWRETYDIQSKEPYGTYAMHQLMSNYFPEKSFNTLDRNISETLPSKTEDISNYVFLGYGWYLDSARTDRLLEFVDGGNNAFIFARMIPPDLLTSFLDFEDCSDYYFDEDFYDEETIETRIRTLGFDGIQDTAVNLRLRHPKLKENNEYKYVEFHETERGYWEHITWNQNCYFEAEEVYDYETDSYYYTEPDDRSREYLSLGYMNDSLINFVRVPHGDGYFYFHTTPIAFTNYFLKQKKNLKYVNQVLAHMDEGDVFWDIENNLQSSPPAIANTGQSNLQLPWNGDRATFNQQTPLQYILSERGFRWAWYLLLGTGVLYLFFRAKRKQRIIPVIEPNKNTSLEFVETIGTLHFQQNDHRQLAMQK